MKPLTICKQNSLMRCDKAVTVFLSNASPCYNYPLHLPRSSSIQLFFSQSPVSAKPLRLRLKVVSASDRKEMHSWLLSVSCFGYRFNIWTGESWALWTICRDNPMISLCFQAEGSVDVSTVLRHTALLTMVQWVFITNHVTVSMCLMCPKLNHSN